MGTYHQVVIGELLVSNPSIAALTLLLRCNLVLKQNVKLESHVLDELGYIGWTNIWKSIRFH